jgi:hypothetical protein
MNGLLIFILIVVALYYVGKWYIRRKIRKFFGQFGQQQGFGRQSQQSSAGPQPSEQADKKKVFTTDEGKYVEFEEIKD